MIFDFLLFFRLLSKIYSNGEIKLARRIKIQISWIYALAWENRNYLILNTTFFGDFDTKMLKLKTEKLSNSYLKEFRAY